MKPAADRDDSVPAWGTRPAAPEDGELLGRLGGGAHEGPGARTLVIEVEGEPAGRIVLEKRSRSVRILDFRLLPDWRHLGIEADAVLRIGVWAAERGLHFAPPPANAFPGADRIRSLLKTEVPRPASAGSGCAAWLYVILGTAVTYVLLGLLGVASRTGLAAPVPWLRPEPIRLGLWLLIAVVIGLSTPAILAEVRGRLRGGAVLLDLGCPCRRWWWIGSAVLLLGALACFATLGFEVPGGGAFGRLLLVPATLTALLSLRRGQLRRHGILRPCFVGFVPFDEVREWERLGGRLLLHLRRELPASDRRLLRLPVGPEAEERADEVLRARLGEPTPEGRPPGPRGWPIPRPALIALLLVLASVATHYEKDLPRERPPGRIAFSVCGDAALDIGEENTLRLQGWVLDEGSGEWVRLDSRCFDLPRERIDLVLCTRDAEGRPVRIGSSIARPGLWGPCRVPPDAQAGAARLLVVFTDGEGRTHEQELSVTLE